jgi:hypothetical protein
MGSGSGMGTGGSLGRAAGFDSFVGVQSVIPDRFSSRRKMIVWRERDIQSREPASGVTHGLRESFPGPRPCPAPGS